jgi:hypothetical protein
MAYIEHGADWVINNDADEFWWPNIGTLKDTFDNIPQEYNIIKANRHNFVAIDNSDPLFYQHMIYREKVSLNPLGQPLPAKVAHRGSNNVVVQQGNHCVSGIGNPRTIDKLIDILHFPIRNYTQLENKIKKGGAAYERNKELPSAIGGTWRELYREYVNNGNLDEYIRRHTYDKERIEKELRSGNLIKDMRLNNFMTKHY